MPKLSKQKKGSVSRADTSLSYIHKLVILNNLPVTLTKEHYYSVIANTGLISQLF